MVLLCVVAAAGLGSGERQVGGNDASRIERQTEGLALPQLWGNESFISDNDRRVEQPQVLLALRSEEALDARPHDAALGGADSWLRCPRQADPRQRLDVGPTVDPVLTAAVAGYGRRDGEAVPESIGMAGESAREPSGLSLGGLYGGQTEVSVAAGKEDVDDGLLDAVPQVGGGTLWLISHYLCEGDETGQYCPLGNLTASGIPVEPGVAACSPELLETRLSIAGTGFLCADTGGAIGPGIIDIWCYSVTFWGRPDCKDEWWCGLPCPAPCEQKIMGADGIQRCYAQVTVLP